MNADKMFDEAISRAAEECDAAIRRVEFSSRFRNIIKCELSASLQSSVPNELLAPFVVQCRARLSDTLPDDAWIMECKGEVVTAGEARAFLKWWDEGEASGGSELQKLRAFYDAAGPLMEQARECLEYQGSFNDAICSHGVYVNDSSIDAAIAAYDAVGEVKREGK